MPAATDAVTVRPARMFVTLVRLDNTRHNNERYNLSHQVFLKEVAMPQSETGSVRVGVAQTINLGNYESLRIDVSIEVPASKDSASAETDWAKALAVQKLSEYKAEALGEDPSQ